MMIEYKVEKCPSYLLIKVNGYLDGYAAEVSGDFYSEITVGSDLSNYRNVVLEVRNMTEEPHSDHRALNTILGN